MKLNNVFTKASALSWITSCAGVVVLVGSTAYDTQKIRSLDVIGNAGTDEDHEEAIHAALVLDLDFINRVSSLLRLLGRRKSRESEFLPRRLSPPQPR